MTEQQRFAFDAVIVASLERADATIPQLAAYGIAREKVVALRP